MRGQTRRGKDYLPLFLQSRDALNVSAGTLQFYTVKLGRFLSEVNSERARQQDIERFLLQFKNPGNRHAYFRAIRTFYNWRERTFNLPSPMKYLKAPRLGKPILPALTREQVETLIEEVGNVRNKALVSLAVESGLRLGELATITPGAINWENHTIRVLGKGRKEAYAPFGELSARYLKEWLAQYQPEGNIWGLNYWGIASMLRRLEAQTGLPCNAHTFRRTFATLLRMGGVDSLVIKELGRWESTAMVETYTRSFNDSLKFYKAPLS